MYGNPRYDDDPLKRLLELYVLWCIDHLSTQDEKALIKIAPHLSKTFNVKGEWHEILFAGVRMDEDLPDLIRAEWGRMTKDARSHGAVADPQKFAELIVDSPAFNG